MKSLSEKQRKILKIIILFITICYLIYLANTNEELEAIITVGSLFISFGLVIYLIFDRFAQKRKVEKLKEASMLVEIDSLKTQINPHFFFNTLNNLYSLTVKKSAAAPKMILKLSDIMRYTIYEGAKEKVSLKDEIAYLENFIELQKIRFKRNLDLKFVQEIEDGDIEIPPLLFIVLVENAFKHGAEMLTENAFIHITLKTSIKSIYFEIKNNCEMVKTETRGGIGIKNLKRRLQLLYPNQHKLILDNISHGLFTATLEVNL